MIKSRLHAVRPRLLAVAEALDRVVTADPVAVARLWTLLRLGMTSPPHSGTLTAEQLDVILRQALWRMAVDRRPIALAQRRSRSTPEP